MSVSSRAVSSSQCEPHPRLDAVVGRHLSTPFRRAAAPYSRTALDAALQAHARHDPRSPVLLDVGCGVGESTLHLAQAHPGHFVIGIDQSASRLERGKDWWQGPVPRNLCWIRADMVDIWLLLAEAQIVVAGQYILYPNPWPKVGHLQRRWHGHAVWPALLAAGGHIEVRSNWQVYVDEFARAVTLANPLRRIAVTPWQPESAITPFERKYLASGQKLYRCLVEPESV